MVTGGIDSNTGDKNYLDSTEIFRNDVWTTVASKLYEKLWGVRAANLNNNVLLFGKPISSSILKKLFNFDNWNGWKF